MTDGQTLRGPSDTWWGSFDLQVGETARWTVGPWSLWVQRLEHEWRLAHHSSGDPAAAQLASGVAADPGGAPADALRCRVAAAHAAGPLVVEPALADRCVVARPQTPLQILAGEELSLYLTTPLWARISAGEPTRLLLDVPLWRPSDTWFGATTEAGELGYASSTAAVTDLGELPPRKASACTELILSNRSRERLGLRRLRLAVHQLPLHAAPDGRLWTPPVRAELHTEAGLPEAREQRGGAALPSGWTPLGQPRQAADSRLLTRTFSALFG